MKSILSINKNKSLVKNALVGNSATHITATQKRYTGGTVWDRRVIGLQDFFKDLDTAVYTPPHLKSKKFKAQKKVHKLWYQPKGLTKQAQKEDPKNPKKGEVQPNKIPARALELLKVIYSSSKEGNPEEAFEAYHRLNRNPNLRAMTVLIKACEKRPDFLGEAIEIYQDILKRGLVPNVITFQTLLNCCISARHWQRAVWVFKEYMVHRKIHHYASINNQNRKFLTSLLTLLYEEDKKDRIVGIYNVLNEMGLAHDLVVAHQQFLQQQAQGKGQEKSEAKESKESKESEELEEVEETAEETAEEKNVTKREPVIYEELPVEFVKVFVEDSSATVYHAMLRYVEDPEFSNPYFTADTQEDVLPYMSSITDVPTISRLNYEMHNASAHEKIEGSALTKPFFFEDKLIGRFFNETMENMDKYLEREQERMKNVKITADLGCSEKQAEKYIHELDNPAMDEKMRRAIEYEDFAEVFEYYDKKRKLLRNKAICKLPWEPVIIGVDGEPFFPKSISIHKIDGARVAAAKAEYIESIPDPQLREDVKNELSDRIKLCWYDTKSGRMIEGLFF